MSHPELELKKKAIRDRAARFESLREPRPFTEKMRAQALEIVNGQLRFNAHDEAIAANLITVGRRGLDWGGGHLHHQEWPTQMSRFFMLGPLMAAYRASGEAPFAEAARDYIDDWMNRFNCEDITLRGNTCMDIGIRLGTHGFGGWACALPVFMDSPAWDDAFVERMLGSMERQSIILWKRGIPSRTWGNHRIFGLDGLLHTALRLPFMADAESMLRYARNGLRDALKQFHDDGVHIEQTLGYHQHMTATYLYLQRLDALFPEAGLNLPVKKLLGAVDYFLHTLPGGINDTAAERLDQDHAAAWALARRWRAQLTGRDESAYLPPRDALFPNAGQVFARSGWEPGADFLAFDAGPYSGCHAHLARLGLVFRAGGRLWLADPGTFDYEMSSPYAVYGRSTPAHNTLNLNGLNQGIGNSFLKFKELADDHVLLHGVYPGGYWNGVYTWGFQQGLGQGTHGIHERIVLWIRGDYLLILDGMMTDPGHTVETVWQLAPVKAWRQDEAKLSWESEGEAPSFHIRALLQPAGTTMTVYQGQKDPLRGWYCDSYGAGFTPAPQVVYRYASDSTFHATLAMPLGGAARPPESRERAFGSGRCLELAWPDGRVDRLLIAASLCTPLDEVEGLETDSALVWLRFAPDGQLQRHVKLGGSFLHYQGRAF